MILIVEFSALQCLLCVPRMQMCGEESLLSGVVVSHRRTATRRRVTAGCDSN